MRRAGRFQSATDAGGGDGGRAPQIHPSKGYWAMGAARLVDHGQFNCGKASECVGDLDRIHGPMCRVDDGDRRREQL